jgi:hypothetical protein
MKYVAGVDSDGVIYIVSFIMIGSVNHKLIGVYTDTQTA